MPLSAPQHTLSHQVRGLSDRAVVWLFVTPTILVLLAIGLVLMAWVRPEGDRREA